MEYKKLTAHSRPKAQILNVRNVYKRQVEIV